MTCEDVRGELLAFQRGQLSAELAREVARHLDACPDCARIRDEEEVLTELLDRRLPRYPASGALKRRLAALAPAADPAPGGEVALPPRPARTRRVTAATLTAAAVLAAGAAVWLQRTAAPGGDLAALTNEAVNDHLRVLRRERPVDVESDRRHEVKPWFEGKLDFAPSVPAPVAPDMRLLGGAVGYFLDREAAVVVYGVRRHVVTLLVFRADGLPWPRATGEADRSPSRSTLRGFHVLLWRSGGLGYALVGDVEPAELSGIAASLASQT